MAAISFGDIPQFYADRKAEGDIALDYPDAALTWRRLDERSSQRAWLLKSLGVSAGEAVTVALPNGAAFHETVFAIWKCGAVPNIVSPRLPEREIREIIELARPRVVIGGPKLDLPGAVRVAEDVDVSSLPTRRFHAPAYKHWKMTTSGGSTGRPKLIVDTTPAQIDFETYILNKQFHMTGDMVVLNPGPLYHNAPFILSNVALFLGSKVVGMAKFDPEEALSLIEAHRVNWVTFVPTMMHRIWSLPRQVRERYDLSSLRAVWHMAAPCPPWLKEAWIDWLGAERIWEFYGASERLGGAIIRGDEWLARRGSVGRPLNPDAVKVLREDGSRCSPGEVGEIYFKTPDPAPYYYIGAAPRLGPDGWESVGDLGWLDEDGYLSLSDRRADLILRGGANIYPAEVEAALDAHPKVGSSVVVGLPCEELGHRVHAIVQPQPGEEIDIGELSAFVSARLVAYKTPETYEFVPDPLWDEAGKVRRSALRAQRLEWLKAGREFRTRKRG